VIRLAAPLAAAASVAAIALAMSLIATGGTGAGQGPSHAGGNAHWDLRAVTTVAQGYAGGKTAAGAQPQYFLGIQHSPHPPTEYAYTAYVYNSVTGQRTGQLRLPRSGLWARAVTSLGNGRYVVAATKDWPHFGCRSWLYQFSLTATGQPTAVKPFVVPTVPGWVADLGGSPDGRMAVLTTMTCGRGNTQYMSSYDNRAFAISSASGATTSWSPWPRSSNLIPENVGPSASVSADGRMLGFVAIAGQPKNFGLEDQAGYVMLTGHVSGPVTRRYHLAVRPRAGAGVIATALSPNGQVTFAMTARRYGGRWHETIGAYSTATGKLIKVLASSSARTVEQNGYLVPDSSGRHLLVMSFGNHNTAVLDVATHHLSDVPVHYRYPPFGAGW
jgi:hypothetical protein